MMKERESLHTPVLLTIFNRPDTTRQIFEAIRRARPEKLYVVADGPRPGNAEDQRKCALARATIQVDWPCELTTWFREENAGCGPGMSSGISWFFDHEEMGIILEDDTLPEPDFFPFCQEMLEKYKDDTRVFHVCGRNALQGWATHPRFSYYFTQAGSIWGWATWRRAWQCYDYRVAGFGELEKEGLMTDFFYNTPDTQYVMDFLRKACKNEEPVSTWDYQWVFTRFANSGLSIVPYQNLVRNIGFGADATHTHGDAGANEIPTGSLTFPLVHPGFVLTNSAVEQYQFNLLYAKSSREKVGAAIRKVMAIFLGKKLATLLWSKLRG